MTEEIDHERTDKIVCPNCGYVRQDLWDIKGAYDEGGTKVYCYRCERTFLSVCHTSYSFTTIRLEG